MTVRVTSSLNTVSTGTAQDKSAACYIARAGVCLLRCVAAVGVQTLDVLEARVTGIAKSKWNMYGHFFVEVLARAEAHFKAQQAGHVSMDEELFIDYNTLPGWNNNGCSDSAPTAAADAPTAAGAQVITVTAPVGRGNTAAAGRGGRGKAAAATAARSGVDSSDDDWDLDDVGEDQQQHRPAAAQTAVAALPGSGSASRLYQQFAFQGPPRPHT